MAAISEQVATDDFGSVGGLKHFCGIPPKRADEIGRLAKAFVDMARHVSSLVSGQRQFIRHIAHELNSSLAKIKPGLAVLEERLDGDARAMVRKIIAETEQLSALTEDVLSHLQAKAAPATPKTETILLCPFLGSTVRGEARDKDVLAP